ncbi:jun-like transcription factor [Coemansia sp. S3946]|nr:jun-like transcription factor [Coemansia sp. S3946]
MTASKVDDLAKVQALLAECGLEKTAAVLLDEAPQISKTNATVQAFLESTTSQDSGKRPRDSDTKGEKVSKAPAKKRRLSLETPVKPKTQTTAPVPQTAPAKAAGKDGRFAKRGEAGNAPNTPFCRIRPEDVVYADERLKDNTYISKGGVENDFGYKAHMDLIVTRGKGFTKEKNKKKRGSYSGGKITMQSHSIKFD